MKMNTRSNRNGGAVVEFALVGSLTFLLLFAIISLGICVWCYNNLADAVRQGARYASVHGSQSLPSGSRVGPGANDPTVTQQVQDWCFVMDQTQLTVTSTWLQGNNNPYSSVQVGATYNYAWFFGLPMMPTLQLATQTTMQITQ